MVRRPKTVARPATRSRSPTSFTASLQRHPVGLQSALAFGVWAAKPVRTPQKAEDQASQDRKPDIAEHAIACAWRPCALLQLLPKFSKSVLV